MSLQAVLNATLTVNDNVPGDISAVKNIQSLSVALSAFNDLPTGVVGTTPVVQTLPATQTCVVIIQNTHATQTLLVTWTPNGGASNPVITLAGPGSIIALVQTASGDGITALSLTGSAAGTTFKMYLAG